MTVFTSLTVKQQPMETEPIISGPFPYVLHMNLVPCSSSYGVLNITSISVSHTVKAHQSHVHHDVPSNAFVQNADDLASYTVALMQLEDATASYHSGGKIWLLVKRKRTE